jgi:hypothetical protein
VNINKSCCFKLKMLLMFPSFPGFSSISFSPGLSSEELWMSHVCVAIDGVWIGE